jgi:hypothetical protein
MAIGPIAIFLELPITEYIKGGTKLVSAKGKVNSGHCRFAVEKLNIVIAM